jgi:hypothetical protein
MAVQRLTTEFFEDDLPVVVLDTVGCFAEAFLASFQAKKLEVAEVSPQDLSYAPTQVLLEKAYKIIVCVSPAHYSPQWLEICEKLEKFQEKIYLVMPVVSGCREQVEGEIPYLSHYSQAQEKLILLCNELLPQASFIFGQDVLLPPGKLSIFDLCCQHIQQGFVFVPNIPITPHTLPQFSDAAVSEILSPHRTSVVIKGRTKFAYTILEKVALQYENYYFCQVGMQRVDAQELPTIPFTTKDKTIATEEDSTALWFSRQLPSPEMEPFFIPQNLIFYVPPAEQKQELPPLPMFERQSLVEPTQPDFWGELLTTEPTDVVPPTSTKTPYTEVISIEETVLTTVSSSPSVPDAVKPAADPMADIFNVSSEVQRIFAHSRLEHASHRVETLAKEKTKLTEKSKKKTMLFYGGLAFVGVGITTLLLMVLFMGTTLLLKNQVLAIVTTPAHEVTQQQLDRAKTVNSIVQKQTAVYEKVLDVPQVGEAIKLGEVMDVLSVLQGPNAQNAQAVKKLFSTVVGSSTGNIAELTENMSTEALTTYEKAGVVEQALQHITFSDTAKSDQVIAEYQTKLKELQKQGQVVQQLAPHLPKMFGAEGKRSYAFILQNNQEIRPTGGFMEAVAILTFENGSLVDQQLFTSYELDKKMTGEVAAPAELSKATGEKRFTFYDTNWSPDFPTSAATIQWFLSKILNKQIDGVVMLDLYGMQNILEATGPLELSDYNEVITNKNLFERVEFHSEVVLLETEKNHDHRKVLFANLLKKIVALPEDKVPALLAAIQKSSTSKALLFSATQPDEQQVFQTLGWAGAQLVPRCPDEFDNGACFIDHFMQAEANIGVNKANYYLKRNIKHSVAVTPLQATHTQQVTYENTAQLEAWPKGAYKSYIRFYLPSSAQQISLIVGDSVVAEKDLSKTIEKDKMIVGAYFEVPIKSTKQLTLTYSVPFPTMPERFSYIFFNNEQPGNGDNPFQLEILPSSELRPQVIAPQATVGADGILFNRLTDESGLFGVEFTQAK